MSVVCQADDGHCTKRFLYFLVVFVRPDWTSQTKGSYPLFRTDIQQLREIYGCLLEIRRFGDGLSLATVRAWTDEFRGTRRSGTSCPVVHGPHHDRRVFFSHPVQSLIEPHRGYERCDKYEAEGTTLGGDVSTWDVILVIESLPGSRLSGAAVGCRLTGGASPSAKQVRHVVHADGRWSG